jgi:geranylgeranyl diphosphate synthase, type II
MSKAVTQNAVVQPQGRSLAIRLHAASKFVESSLEWAIPRADMVPARLANAMRESVFPGGKRVRPLMVHLVAAMYSREEHEMVQRMAAAVELIHCASLVHDDLPAFDNAELRRGKPSCHTMFGEATAILVGDALLALAFEILAQSPIEHAREAMYLTRLLSAATGAGGIIGGQSLELEARVDIDDYHRQKTAALFVAASVGGAVAAGAEQEVPRWQRFGEMVGLGLQLRDDLDDVCGTVEDIGKPVGRDAANAKPNAVNAFGYHHVRRQLLATLAEAEELLGPESEESEPLRYLLRQVGGPYLQPSH